MSQTNDKTFHLGFTMAGAASAGCYTAGVMDYFFEVLNLWEDAKAGILPEGWDKRILDYVPKHNVVIDAMGGTSAGGMTTVMSAIYALKGNIKPVYDPDVELKGKKRDNILYDSWVLMNDDENADTPKLFEKTFGTGDLEESGKIQSLLNSTFIDDICENAFTDDGKPLNKPAYISESLELVLSHTMLRPLPLAVDFTTPINQNRADKQNPAHNTYEHFTVSHYKLDYENLSRFEKVKYIPFDPFGKGKETLKLATKATGAFPVGLKFREVVADRLCSLYLRSTANEITFNRLSDINSPDCPKIKWKEKTPDQYKFVSVDGGAINNEPFGEVMAILKKRYGKKEAGEPYKYALVMIDPFPDLPDPAEYKQPDDLFSVVPALISTLWDQAKVKRGEMLDAYSNNYFRGEIFPVRYVKGRKDPADYPIACGAAMAFSGLLDIDFRHHDFFLGRRNARNFIRTYLTLEFHKDPAKPQGDIVHPIHEDWNDDMIKYLRKPGEPGKTFLPIIPDLHFLKENFEKTYHGPYQGEMPPWPQYDPEKLFALHDKIKARICMMLDLAHAKVTDHKKVDKDEPIHKSTLTEQRMNDFYGNTRWQRFKGKVTTKVISTLFKWNRGNIAEKLAKTAVEKILVDLEKWGLLK